MEQETKIPTGHYNVIIVNALNDGSLTLTFNILDGVYAGEYITRKFYLGDGPRINEYIMFMKGLGLDVNIEDIDDLLGIKTEVFHELAA